MKEANTAFRKAMRNNKFNPVGWKLLWVGSVFTASCSRFDVTLAEVLWVQEYMRTHFSEACGWMTGSKPHIGANDTYGALINWYN